MNIEFYKKLKIELKKYPQKPKFLAVTKYSSVEEINFAIKNGIKLIGENRVEIAEEKFPQLLGNPEKHFIGAVQTKKLKKIFHLFDVIQSIGNLKQLKKIYSIAKEEGKIARIYLQFNISNEEQKSGFLEKDIGEILQFSKELSSKGQENLKIEGIMGMASKSDEKEVRKQFKNAKNIFDKLKKEISSIQELSIGMSGDYKIALEEGATIPRIGSFLFK